MTRKYIGARLSTGQEVYLTRKEVALAKKRTKRIEKKRKKRKK